MITSPFLSLHGLIISMMFKLREVLLPLVLLLLSACAVGNKTSMEKKNIFSGGKWNIEELSEKKIDPAKAGNQVPFIDFNMNDKLVSLFAGCNRLSTGFEIRNDTITFQNIIATRMACPEMEYETTLSQLLAPGDYTFSEKNNSLLIFKKGKEILQLIRP